MTITKNSKSSLITGSTSSTNRRTTLYTAHVLTPASRMELMLAFEPAYAKIIAHHITIKFGVPVETETPVAADVRVMGVVDSGDGLQVLVCEVDGTTKRPDGGTYHITWSLNPDKYKPVDSNELLLHKRYKMGIPIPVETTPAVLV